MSRRLLDTHPLLWALADDPRLPRQLATAIDRDPGSFLVSDASFWEIAVKRAVGKMDVPDDLPQIVDDLGLVSLPIARRHAWAVSGLELHHRDPFDRLLIAQARDLDVAIVSADAAFVAYDVEVHWPVG